ncbi:MULTISPECIES: hypothetical protein [unclassified Caballeronia]|uniref:hypothetical protein n=1 Tax=unclassified Caballeronia TaxID=2646786 RepID=UPI00285D6D06|nr:MULTISPECIES: hypothetical protein [unclassified Caballeronia]MDR5772100.1 hypothetical protein [Caballeronia sp. LZ002]MDR5847534.1 hypothetical protein [Caballeronia sp. LZ003]
MNARTYPTPTQPSVISALLPPEAREILARAANEAKGITGEAARTAHIEAAIARVRFYYPRFFK